MEFVFYSRRGVYPPAKRKVLKQKIICLCLWGTVPSFARNRLLSTGVCRGGTPQAFTRRRAERDAARQARKAEEDRRESAMVDIRKKNAAVIAAANAAKGAGGSLLLS